MRAERLFRQLDELQKREAHSVGVRCSLRASRRKHTVSWAKYRSWDPFVCPRLSRRLSAPQRFGTKREFWCYIG